VLSQGRIGDERFAVTGARIHEARSHVLAKQRDLSGLDAVARREHTYGIAVVADVEFAPKLISAISLWSPQPQTRRPV
jgi:hypothetical protein